MTPAIISSHKGNHGAANRALLGVIAITALFTPFAASAQSVASATSPNGTVKVDITIDGDGRVAYASTYCLRLKLR